MAKRPSKSAASPAPQPQPTRKSDNVVARARGRGAAGAQETRRRWIWENFKSLAGAVLIYLVIKTFFVEAFRIPSGSMIPTLLIGDWLFVNKLRYGPHIPFTSGRLPGYADPQREDVVVFVSPPQIDQPWDPTPTVVKRLMGMPGDTLYMRGGLLYVNGVARPQPPEAAANPVGNPDETSQLFEWQGSIALRDTRFGSAPDVPTHDHWGPLLVPPNFYFMMGDNRYQSKDSRYWGIVPRENLRGRPMFVYYSYVPSGESDRPASFLTDIRWRRLGHWIR